MRSINTDDVAILHINGTDFIVLLKELAKLKPQIYCKMLTWPKKMGDHKVYCI